MGVRVLDPLKNEESGGLKNRGETLANDRLGGMSLSRCDKSGNTTNHRKTLFRNTATVLC